MLEGSQGSVDELQQQVAAAAKPRSVRCCSIDPGVQDILTSVFKVRHLGTWR
jgi:hypothetical protein